VVMSLVVVSKIVSALCYVNTQYDTGRRVQIHSRDTLRIW
jgi:hypothetical protein